MPTINTLAVIAAVLFASAAHALSPTDGHIADKSYVNSYFHLAYTWPAMLTPAKLPAAPADANSPTAYMFPLFTARQGNQPYGVVVVAEKLNVPGPHSSGIKSSAEFIDRVASSLRSAPMLSRITRTERKNARGMIFEELSYRLNGNPAALMATQLGQYLIVFKCNAQSATDFARMENSVLKLRKLK